MSKFQKGVITLSIDDGRKDAYRLFKELLTVYNLPATFNITTAFIDAACLGNKGSITLDELKEMGKSPLVEIAGHGHTHKNDDADICKGKEILYEWLDFDTNEIGFASPGSGMDEAYVRENAQKLSEMGFLYVRSGFSDSPRNNEVRERHGECTGINELYFAFDNMCLYSVPVLCGTTVEKIKQMIDIAAKEKACLTLMFHSVRKKGEYDPKDLWSYDYDKFEQVMQYLSQKRDAGEIEILTTKDAFLKGKTF